MSDNEVLSQGEIEALLNGVDSGEIDAPEAKTEASGGDLELYDFSDQNPIISGRMPAIDRINDEFINCFRDSIMTMLRKTTEVEIKEVSMIKFLEYRASISSPSSLHIIRFRPLRGTAVIVMDTDLAFMVVDYFYGGRGRQQIKTEDRKLAPTEMRVLQLLYELIKKDLETAWRQVMPLTIELASHEVNPQMLNIAGPVEIVVLSVFKLGIEGSTGELHVCMPYSMIEPIRKQLDAGANAEMDEIDGKWSKDLQKGLMNAEVGLSCKLADFKLTLDQIMKLKDGDIIPIELPETLTVSVEKIPFCKAKYGRSRDFRAFKVTDRIIY